MKRLNLGCGKRYHPDWINIDFKSDGQAVIAYDLHQGIPFPDETFDTVYHSHLLEHFPRSEAPVFLRECYRVLKPDGVLRVVVPDLETIIDQYIKWRDLASNGDEMAAFNYDWIMLELYDQAVRHWGGGEMGKYLTQTHIPNEAFVRERLGYFFDLIRSPYIPTPDSKPKSQLQKLNKFTLMRLATIHPIQTIYRNSKSLLKVWRSRLGNRPSSTEIYLKVGRFRLSGEVHLWMYDRYSLSRLLTTCGFETPHVCTALQSAIPGWTEYGLDTEPDGSLYKRDSLFMEATK